MYPTFPDPPCSLFYGPNLLFFSYLVSHIFLCFRSLPPTLYEEPRGEYLSLNSTIPISVNILFSNSFPRAALTVSWLLSHHLALLFSVYTWFPSHIYAFFFRRKECLLARNPPSDGCPSFPLSFRKPFSFLTFFCLPFLGRFELCTLSPLLSPFLISLSETFVLESCPSPPLHCPQFFPNSFLNSFFTPKSKVPLLFSFVPTGFGDPCFFLSLFSLSTNLVTCDLLHQSARIFPLSSFFAPPGLFFFFSPSKHFRKLSAAILAYTHPCLCRRHVTDHVLPPIRPLWPFLFPPFPFLYWF